jgi:hypothetical protein
MSSCVLIATTKNISLDEGPSADSKTTPIEVLAHHRLGNSAVVLGLKHFAHLAEEGNAINYIFYTLYPQIL